MSHSHTEHNLYLCCEALEAKKALDLKVFDVRGQSTITDYFIVASANSEPHLRALYKIIDEICTEQKIKIIGIDYESGSGWFVIDAFDIIIHVLTEEKRALYKLEHLWKKSQLIDFKKLM